MEKDGKKYFAKANGAFYHNCFISFGKTTYYMNSDGSVVKDTVFNYKGNNYYSDKDGVVAKNKWVEKGNNSFYAGPTGAFYHNQFISFGQKYYYLNTSGAVIKTPFTYNGIQLTPDPKTGVISKAAHDYAVADHKYNGYTTYVLVNISQQRMEYVRNGRIVVETPVITGMKNRFDTPKGTYSVLSKSRNVNLKGQVEDDEWDVMVNYWVAFIGGSYGFHDAGWKSGFGGSTYTWNGSHGCINMPLDAAAKFYNEVSVGTRVFII